MGTVAKDGTTHDMSERSDRTLDGAADGASDGPSEAAHADALVVDGVDFSYGHVQVLFSVDLSVRDGEVLALLGTNGAGKSTVLRCVSGLQQVDRGRVVHRGRDITQVSAVDRVRGGIVQLSGGRSVFPHVTVRENLLAGAYQHVWDRGELESRIEQAFARFPILAARAGQAAGTLSGGEQQMLALAKALSIDPDVLCIDELSLGLAPIVVGQLLEAVAGLREEGVTMIIVEQSLKVALELADRAAFMEKGRVRFSGPAQELAERDDLARAVFLGGEGG